MARAAARGIKLWIGIYLSNYYQHATPLDEWFDDAAWSTRLLPKLGDLAGAAHMLGFAGLAFDEEQYYSGSWRWNYPANTHSEAEVRAEVRARGAQMMQTIVNAFPGVDLIDYGTYFPEGWNALVQQQINHAQNAYVDRPQINLWDGLTSVPGYGPIRFMDATFYKTAHLSGATWDNAMTYNVNRLMAYFSRNLTNWSYASSRINISPFAWIDGDVQNEGSFTAPRPPAYVAEQLAAFRRWGMGGAFAIYSYAPLGTFDYTPYTAAMQAASIPGTIDTQPPGITTNTLQRTSSGVVVSGTATDNMAVSSVRWQAGPRRCGSADVVGDRRRLAHRLPVAHGLDRDHPGVCRSSDHVYRAGQHRVHNRRERDRAIRRPLGAPQSRPLRSRLRHGQNCQGGAAFARVVSRRLAPRGRRVDFTRRRLRPSYARCHPSLESRLNVNLDVNRDRRRRRCESDGVLDRL